MSPQIPNSNILNPYLRNNNKFKPPKKKSTNQLSIELASKEEFKHSLSDVESVSGAESASRVSHQDIKV